MSSEKLVHTPSVADRLLGPILENEVHTKRTRLYKVLYYGTLGFYTLFQVMIIGIFARMCYEFKNKSYYYYYQNEALVPPMVWHLDDDNNYVFYSAIMGIVASIIGLIGLPSGVLAGINQLGRNAVIVSCMLFLLAMTTNFFLQMASIFIPLALVNKFGFTTYFYPMAFVATLILGFALGIQTSIQVYFAAKEVAPEKPKEQPVTLQPEIAAV